MTTNRQALGCGVMLLAACAAAPRELLIHEPVSSSFTMPQSDLAHASPLRELPEPITLAVVTDAAARTATMLAAPFSPSPMAGTIHVLHGKSVAIAPYNVPPPVVVHEWRLPIVGNTLRADFLTSSISAPQDYIAWVVCEVRATDSHEQVDMTPIGWPGSWLHLDPTKAFTAWPGSEPSNWLYRAPGDEGRIRVQLPLTEDLLGKTVLLQAAMLAPVWALASDYAEDFAFLEGTLALLGIRYVARWEPLLSTGLSISVGR